MGPGLVCRYRERLYGWLWRTSLADLPPGRRRFRQAARLAYAIGRDISEGQLTLRATSLVYSTLLSLVPVLALAFSVLKSLGVHNYIRPTLLALLAPLGAKGGAIADQVAAFVDHLQVGVLGAMGLALLIYTVATLLQKIEDDLNYVWRVERGRSLSQRFSQYLSVVTVGPVLVFAALGVTGMLLGNRWVKVLIAVAPLGFLVRLAGQLLPYLLVIAALVFIYVLMTNARVRWVSALVGASVGGLLWQSLGWGFATFVANSGKYTAIYAGFAIVVLFMMWLYLSWLSVLIGASVAYYHQHPGQLATPRREAKLSNRVRERLALLAMADIAKRFLHGQPIWTLDALAQHMGVPAATLAPLLEVMRAGGHLAESDDDPPRYLPARAPEAMPVKALLDTVRAAGEGANIAPGALPGDPGVEEALVRLDQAAEAALNGLSLRDLALGPRPAADAGTPPG
jgi:membrane protein